MSLNKKIIILCLSLFILFLSVGLFITLNLIHNNKLVSPIIKEKVIPTVKPLEKYSFENLKMGEFVPGTITFDKVIKEDPFFLSYLFYFTSEGKKVSGLANFPKPEGKYPVIIQLRGFINPLNYETGDGTKRSGQVFAQNSFITLSPDFLGYGQSATQSAYPMEERFQTYTTILDLFSSLPFLNPALDKLNIGIKADTGKVGLWGHSNGGHIALSVLSITGKNLPTVLWNPVSKPFPYSILFYSDEAEDKGKFLRKLIADFEKDYTVEKYSPPNYFDWIEAPIELHQAEADEAVPKRWSDELYQNLKELNKDITYYTYPNEDHDFHNGSWSQVVERNIAFYGKHFSKD